MGSDEKLLAGLRSHLYQMVVLHHCPEDKDLFCQRYLDEQLFISITKDHPLANQDSVTFEELKGLRILMTAHVGFWMDITLEKLNASDPLIQNGMDACLASEQQKYRSVFSAVRGNLLRSQS